MQILQGALLLATVSLSVVTRGEDDISAVCNIEASSGDPSVPLQGSVTFSQNVDGGNVTLSVQLTGFNDTDNVTLHGFHVHASGELGNGCRDALGHYNPEGVDHGGPMDAIRHVGDLGNIEEDGSGNVSTVFTDNVIQLVGAYSIIGKSIVVHERKDDLGLGGFSDSKTTGHAGARLACCTITSSDVRMRQAVCNIASDSGSSSDPVEGTVTFEQKIFGEPSTIRVDLSGFNTDDSNELHGFHVHAKGNLSNGCKAAGGHFNPFGRLHGGPSNNITSRHVGDLGNIQEDAGGEVEVTISDHMVSLWGDYSVMGKAVVVHEREDDLGTGDTEASRTTGDAGGRIACCIIEEPSTSEPSTSEPSTSEPSTSDPPTSVPPISAAVRLLTSSAPVMLIVFVFTLF